MNNKGFQATRTSPFSPPYEGGAGGGGDDRPTVVVAATSQTTLQVLSGPETGRLLTLPEFPCRIGRGGASELLLADPTDPPTLSREHATFAHPTGNSLEFLVTDHSRNGTTVGGHRLTHGMSEILRPGTLLQLGSGLRLLFQQEANRDAKALPPYAPGKVENTPNIPPPPPIQHSPAALPADFRAFLTSPATLHAAWKRVALNRGGAGPDNVTLHEFAQDADRRLDALRTLLVKGRYEPLPARLFAAPKRSGGVRAIAILSIQDRIVQQALHAALQPHLEPHFPACSYAYRPGVSAHHALRAVDSQLSQGSLWVGETDIARFFDTIGHEVLLQQLRALVPDPFVLSLVARCLAVSGTGGRGIPQGAATSPLFSNLYLAEFDAAMLASGRNPIRYGDDLLFPCRERGQAQTALAETEGFLRSRLGLTLKPEKTGVASLAQGFTFLGFQFTEAGRKAAPQAISQLAERLQEVAPAYAPAVLRGWKTYFGDLPASQTANSGNPASPPEVTSPSELQEAEMARFLNLFGGREDTHARQSNSNGKTRFTPCAGPLTPELVQDHLSGQATLATYLVRQDGRVGHIVLDMDIVASPGRPAAHGQPSASEMEVVVRFAAELQRICREVGLPATLEDSGRRGRHLWIFFAEPIAPDRARRLGHLLALRAGHPCAGIRLEILPRHSDWPGPELGDAVKLPLGVHPLTGRRCFLLNPAGDPIPDFLTALERIRTLPSERVEELIGVLSRTTEETPRQKKTEPEESPAVAQLVAGCSVLRGLVERAQNTGHLRHTHQLILLYTAGRLGAEGAAFLHRTIAHCHNYDAQICQGYIDRLETNHPPLSCRRIREWLAEEGESGLCTCAATRRTPLEGVAPSPHPEDAPTASVLAPASARKPRASGFPAPRPPRASAMKVEEWREVTEDLFGSTETLETAGPETETLKMETPQTETRETAIPNGEEESQP